MKLLSVIVPIYNTDELLLRRCLNMFVNELPEVELIIVDDGSNEKCRLLELELLKTIATSSKIFFKKNGGQNSARQVGIINSVGRYLLFLDSDDYLDLPSFGKVLDILRIDSPDVLAYNVQVVDRKGKKLYSYEYFSEDSTKLDGRTLILQSRTLYGQIIRKTLFDDCSLVQGSTIGEDLASVVPILAKAESIIAISDRLYCYVKHDSSVTNIFSSKNIFDILISFDGLLVRMKDKLSIYAVEVEWLAIQHILFYGAKRIIDSVGVDEKAKYILYNYMEVKFPQWKKNKYLFTKRYKFGIVFCLLVYGHWRLYSFLRNAKRNIFLFCKR